MAVASATGRDVVVPDSLADLLQAIDGESVDPWSMDAERVIVDPTRPAIRNWKPETPPVQAKSAEDYPTEWTLDPGF